MAGIDSYTKLMLHCDGDDASTSFPDSSSSNHTVTANGNAQVDVLTPETKKFDQACLLDGTGDYLSTPEHDDWDFGSGDWTIDFWVRFLTSYASWSEEEKPVFVSHCDGSFNNRLHVNWYGGLNIYCTVGGTNKADYKVNWSPNIDQWYHLAFERSGTGAYIFIDGVSQSLTETKSWGSDSLDNINGNLNIGWLGVSGSGYILKGWMDEVRISKGIARWTSDFTPPTEEYSEPAVTGQFLSPNTKYW